MTVSERASLVGVGHHLVHHLTVGEGVALRVGYPVRERFRRSSQGAYGTVQETSSGVKIVVVLASGVIFIGAMGEIGLRSTIGVAWLGMGILIFVFEIIVSVLQAYIFTLPSAVYIQTSVHPEH